MGFVSRHRTALLFLCAMMALPSPTMALVLPLRASVDYLSSLAKNNPLGQSSMPYSPPVNGRTQNNRETSNVVETRAPSAPVTPRSARDDEGRHADPYMELSHASLAFFDRSQLALKGPRKNADVGRPYDATRELVTVGDTLSAGSWSCTVGGWPSPTPRDSTEVFFVRSGQGRVTDADGRPHNFGAGDTVILPKGWSGRWDILEDIHKVWFVNEHPHVEERSQPIRAVVTPFDDLAPQFLTPQGPMLDATRGGPRTASARIYRAGPTTVGCWACTPGSFFVENMPKTECFIVLEGLFFLTEKGGRAQRCVAGDTVVLPKGWSGHWDIIEMVHKLWVIVD